MSGSISALLAASLALSACSGNSKTPERATDDGTEVGSAAKPDGAVPVLRDASAGGSTGTGSARPADAGRVAQLDARVAPASAEAGTPAAADGASGDSSSDAGGVTTAPPATGSVFPAVTDAWKAGPFAVATGMGAGPSRNAALFYPRELGQGGVKHPIVIFDNGAGQSGTSIYVSIVQHLASHGFAVYHAYESTDDGKEITDGIVWMIAEAARSGSMFFGKLDITKVAAMGHSRGSIATFSGGADRRLTTTIHLSGGTNPDIAKGHETLANVHNPAAFLCGEPGGDGLVSGDAASEWCLYDFEHATAPVFLTQITGASHISAPGMTPGACAGWLRWRLMGDSTMKAMFAGTDCSLCKRPNWVVKQRGLDAIP